MAPALAALSAQPIAGTENTDPNSHSFWSADSRHLGFFAQGKLKRIAVAGGLPQTLCEARGLGGTWNQDNVILFDDHGSLRRVPAAGGSSTVVRAPDKSRKEVAYRWPSFLPDGRNFVYVAENADQGRTEIRTGLLDSKSDKALFAAGSRALYSSNHLLFVSGGTLFAQPFDTKSLSLAGDAFPAVSEPIAYSGGIGYAAFSASTNGTLVYRTLSQANDTELTWFDRSGKQLGLAPVIGHIQRPHLAADQNHIAVEKNDSAGTDIWVIDLSKGSSSRFTYDPAEDVYPIFSFDGKQIAFASNRGGTFGVYVKAAAGTGSDEPIQSVEGASNLGIADWSRDGKVLLYNVLAAATGWDTWAIPVTGDRKAFPVLNGKQGELRTRFSPDGRWILYTSDETGITEIYVQTFPPSGGKWQVSVGGGIDAYWRGDGKEIVFNSIDGNMMAVDVKLGTNFEKDVPHVLFKIPGAIVASRFVVTANAQRFLLPLTAKAASRPTLTAVLNWTADIKK